MTAELQAAGRRAVACPADVSDFEALPAIVDTTVRQLGGLDVLVNSAGGGYHWYSFDDTSLEIIEEQFRFTVMSVYALVKAAAPHLLERPGASIINIGSVTVGTASRVTSPMRRPRRRWCR